VCGVCARLASWLLCFSCVCYLYIKNVTPSCTRLSPCDGFQFEIYLYIVNSRHYPLVNCGAGDRAHNASVRAPGARGAGRLVPLPP